jgi:predicted nucleic acid-binding protein
MNDRVFLDTNMFVYDVDIEAPQNREEIAGRLIHRAISEHRSVVSYQVVQEFLAVVRDTGLIVATASDARCSVLYTEDLQHGARIGGVRIDDPFRSKPAN